jgi:hypothetical protein
MRLFIAAVPVRVDQSTHATGLSQGESCRIDGMGARRFAKITITLLGSDDPR